MRHFFPILLLFLHLHTLTGQTGGDNTYEFLNLGHSAFATATGGLTVSQGRNDLSLPYFNPSLLSGSMDNDISLSFSTYFAGINYGYASWAKSLKSKGNIAAGVSFISYGSFTEADAEGNITGTFTAAEYAFNLMWSFQFDSSFTAGINIKPVFSHLERYFSAGICADIGAAYHNKKLLLDAGLVIRNAGAQIITYTGQGGEPLPFEIIAGVTKALEHAPFRFSLTFRHIEKPDLTFDYDSDDENTAGGFGESLLRHMILGVEILPADAFWIGAGFNYQRRAEMAIDERPGMAGFTWGFGIRSRSFDLAFGRETFHLAGSSNHLTITLRTDYLINKSKR
ncbi:MAG: type IX secretion system protein PorQ [Bacteroidales bacterium]|jgi:hypothetical protein|nr:type IX secretion system protein PorQ [Bacteroidales bacterium]